ncbi:hypothetical protein HDU92_008138 [Lobulomyces angularis]|nr:hypothetical protein HDU92_008138 [Lobulomyces angularis]
MNESLGVFVVLENRFVLVVLVGSATPALKISTATRLNYAGIFLLTSILSYSMLTDFIEKHLEKLTLGYFNIQCGDRSCFGLIAVYRICFASTHGVLSSLTYGVRDSRDWRSKVQNSYWGLKLLVWLGLVVLTFLIPNGFYLFIGTWFNVPGAAVFVLIQIVLLIDFAYNVSETLIEKWEETNEKKFLIFLCILTFGAFILAIVLTGLNYSWFGGSQCQLNQFFITFNLLLCFFVTIVSILPSVQSVNPKSGIAQAAMVTIYSTYLITSAVANEPSENDTCNPLTAGGAKTTTIILGSLFTFLALAYSTNSAATKFHNGGEENLPLITEQPGRLQQVSIIFTI